MRLTSEASLLGCSLSNSLYLVELMHKCCGYELYIPQQLLRFFHSSSKDQRPLFLLFDLRVSLAPCYPSLLLAFCLPLVDLCLILHCSDASFLRAFGYYYLFSSYSFNVSSLNLLSGVSIVQNHNDQVAGHKN